MKKFSSDQRGAIAILFALMLTVTMGTAGIAIDYSRSESVRAELQSILDAATLAAAAQYQASGRDVQETGSHYISQKPLPSEGAIEQVSVQKTGQKITASARARLPALITHLLTNTDTIYVAARSEVSLATNYSDFHLIIDVSESMNIAATPDEIARFEAITAPYTLPATGEPGCAFGCHVQESTSPPGVTMFQIARQNNILLRSDVVRNSAIELARTLLHSTYQRQWRVGVAHFSDTFSVRLSASSDVAAVEAAIADPLITPLGSMLNNYASAAANFVGNSGTGRDPSSPKKYAIIASDGVMRGREPKDPLNSNVCDALKAQGVTVVVLYVRQFPLNGAWAYDIWVAPRLAEYETAMRNCASGSGYFFEAQNAAEITDSFKRISDELTARSIALTR